MEVVDYNDVDFNDPNIAYIEYEEVWTVVYPEGRVIVTKNVPQDGL